MEWTDDGIVLGARRHGETSAIVEVMTRGHGRHLGLVRGGSGSRLRPLLQPGNTVRVVWRARLHPTLRGPPPLRRPAAGPAPAVFVRWCSPPPPCGWSVARGSPTSSGAARARPPARC